MTLLNNSILLEKHTILKKLLLGKEEVLIALAKQQDLEKYNYTVLIVNSGEKAIETLKGNSNINLILMYIDLGRGIDGTIAAEFILKIITLQK